MRAAALTSRSCPTFPRVLAPVLGSLGFHASSTFQADVVSAVAAIISLNIVIVVYIASAMSEANSITQPGVEDKDD